jgi:iron complex outermembrane receptor protein
LLFFLFPLFGWTQINLKGLVIDSETGKGIANANVMVGDIGVSTNSEGYFYLKGVNFGTNKIHISIIGYREYFGEFNLTIMKNDTIKFFLKKDDYSIEEVVVTATRNDACISLLPARVEVLTSKKLDFTAGQTIDEQLTVISGLYTNRTFGPFSHTSSVSMRGLSGSEQARTLVLVDGIPVNKSDGGSVNWNFLSTQSIDKVEVVKGPSSALYGSNAMAGVINIISKEPKSKFEGKVVGEYGTYNTNGIKANIGARYGSNSAKSFYWETNGYYRKSDGYFNQSPEDLERLGDYAVKSNLDEKALSLKVGYKNSQKLKAEIITSIYDDRRGLGEKYEQPDGNYADHDSYHVKSSIKGKHGKIGWDVSLFYLKEKYKKVNEFYRKGSYVWYNVESNRVDYGLLSMVNIPIKNHVLSSGFDIRNGAVDASDIYQTSTDRVDNQGKINFYGFFIEDEFYSFSKKLTFNIGVRYDLACFHDASFTIYDPTAATDYLTVFQYSNQPVETWGALSPRLSMQFRPSNRLRVYASYSRGFRPPVLDDLTRTGRVRGGVKVAKPNLRPEKLDNYELGTDYRPFSWIKLSASAFLSIGKDFLYYVSNGDNIDFGYKKLPIKVRANISNVKIYGLELGLSANPFKGITLFANSTFTSPTIQKYEPLSENDTINLEGKYLTDVPLFSFNFGSFVKTKLVNIGIVGRYLSDMYINDLNVEDDNIHSNIYPKTFVVDIKLSRTILHQFNAALGIQNVFDKNIYNSSGSVGPGRFLTFSLGVEF